MQTDQTFYSFENPPSSPLSRTIRSDPSPTKTPPTSQRRRRTNSRSFYNGHPDTDSDLDDEDLVSKLARERQEKREVILNPLASSSPIREEIRNPRFNSKAIGEKYTLRTSRYVPFRSQFQKNIRDQRRIDTQLALRGGVEGMARDIEMIEHEERVRRLNAEAQLYQLDEIDQDDLEKKNQFNDNELDEEKFWINNQQDFYQQELEAMIKQEEEELEAMINDMNLDA